jgi:hypothetical protein
VADRKRALAMQPDIRFVGHAVVDAGSGEPVVYTENLFVKFADDRPADACREVWPRRARCGRQPHQQLRRHLDGFPSASLAARFDPASVAALQALKGSKADGVWTLTLQDRGVGNAGLVRRCALELSLERRTAARERAAEPKVPANGPNRRAPRRRRARPAGEAPPALA